MSEQTQGNNQQIIVIGLIVIAALLAAIVGVLIYQQSRAVPGTAVNQTSTTVDNTASTGNGSATGAEATPFDPKTATKVTAGSTPEQHLKAYNEDILKGKYAEAYAMLPLDKQKSYGTAAAYESQLKGYNITKYTMGKPVTKDNGNTVEIVTEQVTPQMPIAYTWTFKKVGGTWYVASRNMGGTVQ